MAFEKLRAYQAACELRAEVDKLRESLNPRFEDLFRHVDEAVDSIKNNLAEGGESIYPGKQKLFYDHAGGSAREARSGLRSIADRKGFGSASATRAIVLTIVIWKMITALMKKLPVSQTP
jgi:four helix bundle protein